MATNVSRGAAAKGRTKKYLQERGYQVADLEVVRYIFAKGGRMPVKRDQFGSDLLAVNDLEVVFVQVKSGKTATGGTFAGARREFEHVARPVLGEHAARHGTGGVKADQVVFVAGTADLVEPDDRLDGLTLSEVVAKRRQRVIGVLG